MTPSGTAKTWRIASLSALVMSLLGPAAMAQSPGRPSDSSRPFEITDNSFLVEEAFNQEPGIFQNIFNLVLDGSGVWAASFTQEWPLASQTHQLSFTVPYVSVGSASGFGDAFVHYRIQLLDGTDGRPAFSPRVSLVIPSGRSSRGLGSGSPGWQVNLPFSKQVRDVFFHWNAGFTHFPSPEIDGTTFNLMTPHAAASGIWRVRPMFNVMLEGLVLWEDLVQDGIAGRSTVVTLMPGVRTGWDVGETQTIVGVGVPLRLADGATDAGAFLYLSYELPFMNK